MVDVSPVVTDIVMDWIRNLKGGFDTLRRFALRDGHLKLQIGYML